MTRTKITRTDRNYVRLEALDPFTGDPIVREFRCPDVSRGSFSYVWEGDKQVCSGLSRMGATLRATPTTLVDVIRAEWRAYRMSAKRQGF
jgi:hypothetical protein